MLPHPRRLSKRRSSDGAAGATRQPVAVEGSWKQCIEKFRQELETQLKLIWLANSEQTREDAVEHLRRHFHSVTQHTVALGFGCVTYSTASNNLFIVRIIVCV